MKPHLSTSDMTYPCTHMHMHMHAQQLLMDRELSETVKDIYFTVLDKLCVDHFHTALDIAQSGRTAWCCCVCVCV